MTASLSILNETFSVIFKDCDVLCFTGCELESHQECLWIIKSSDDKKALIQFKFNSQFPFDECQASTNRLQVYDGSPPFLSRESQSQSLGSFCLNQAENVVAASGAMTIYYVCNGPSAGFNASFAILNVRIILIFKRIFCKLSLKLNKLFAKKVGKVGAKMHEFYYGTQ